MIEWADIDWDNDGLKVERDAKIGKISFENYVQQKVEILIALRQLGDSLDDQEIDFLQTNASDALKEFERVTDEQGIHLFGYSYINCFI